jgi:hypothetical protein
MAGNPSKVKVEAAWVSFDGTDLGYTKGGITIDFQVQTHPIVIPHLGNTPIAEPITGKLATIKVPMAETDYNRILILFHKTATIGTDIMLGGGVLFIAPLQTDGEFLSFRNAVPTGNGGTYINFDKERVWTGEFKGYMNESDEIFWLEEGS